MAQSDTGEAIAAERDDHASAVEPLVPRWAVWCYLLAPPLLALLLYPDLLEQPMAVIVPRLAVTWVHTVAIGATLHALYTWVVPRILDKVERPPRKLAVHFATIVVGIVTALGVTGPLSYRLLGHLRWRPWWALYASLLISAAFVTFMVTYQRLRRHAREVELRAEHAHQAALRARLASLAARTNPHFLFNSLNTVAGLVAEDPERAEEAVVQLAELFRYTLDASRRPRVALADEIEVVRSYLRMESLRFEERLCYTIDASAEVLACRALPLSVQPLVENAIKHGVEGRGWGTVTVCARLDGKAVELTVGDDGPGPGGSSHSGSGTSIEDLRQRLDLAYRDEGRLEVRPRPGGGTEVLLRFPAEGA